MKKKIIMANAIMLPLILVFDILYMINSELLSKSIASLMFVITGIINFNYCTKNKINLKYPKWMLGALICTMLADILLVLNFYVGTIVFAIGHILYFTSYCNLEKIDKNDFKYGIIIGVFSLSIILFTPFLNFDNSIMKTICCIYAIIISFMVGKTISNLRKENNSTNKIITIGSILFFISDFMLMLDVFGGISVTGYLCLATYYPAQFLLALSIFIYGSNNLLEEERRNIA